MYFTTFRRIIMQGYCAEICKKSAFLTYITDKFLDPGVLVILSDIKMLSDHFFAIGTISTVVSLSQLSFAIRWPRGKA